MFYKVLMEKRAAALEEYYAPSDKIRRAKRVLSKMHPDDQMEALYGATYDYGIDDEDELRREIKKRRSIAGGISGAALGALGMAGLRKMRKLPANNKALRYGALGLSALGALGARATVSDDDDPVYTREVKRIRGLQKRLPKLSTDEKSTLMDILYPG